MNIWDEKLSSYIVYVFLEYIFDTPINDHLYIGGLRKWNYDYDKQQDILGFNGCISDIEYRRYTKSKNGMIRTGMRLLFFSQDTKYYEKINCNEKCNN